MLKKSIAAVGLFLLLVIIINFGIHFLWTMNHHDGKATEDIYENLAVSLIISWIIFLIAYYVWAIQFYNINQGWTDADWKKNEEAKDMNFRMGSEIEPDGNPNKGESLGLPPGTVRATIALSLLVAGLAMTIASLSMNNTYPANALFIDNFEFFKTAFLMMIAFYFGAKSLDALRKTNINTGSIATQKNDGLNPALNPSPDPDPVIKAEPDTLNDSKAKG
ncbi:MAG: hypothetical protein ACHQNT_11210 [Bacteroidia bacterium]